MKDSSSGGSDSWRRGLPLLNPAWYGAPALVYYLGMSGKAEHLRSVPFIHDVARWLYHPSVPKLPSGWPRPPMEALPPPLPLHALIAGLSLVLLPAAVAGVFWVLWPLRHQVAQTQLKSNSRPHRFYEVGAVLSFCLFFWGTLWSPDPGSCTRCPAPNTSFHWFLAAGGLFVMSLLPYLIALSLYVRLAFWTRDTEPRRQAAAFNKPPPSDG